MKADAAFLADWDASHDTAWKVGRWLADRGLNVAVPVPKLRPDAGVRDRFADDGDLTITKRIEVKHRSVDFTGAHDYPFDTIFVNEAYKLTRERLMGVWAYAIVNKARTHVALIKPSTFTDWVVVSRWDAAQSRSCDFYACPVSKASFHVLP